MSYRNEAEFENAVINELQHHGWEAKVLKYKTEEDLIQNWANILYENNRQIDRLGDFPLTKGEMSQILLQIRNIKTPLNINNFINGKSVKIIRDNSDDKNHFGKEVNLKIYDRSEIAAGQSRYQIAEQPVFHKTNPLATNNRGDFMLLINGMPVIHVELKNSGHSVAEAYNQIDRYRKEGVFSGLFSLIQVFVAMEPNETVYFANPGNDAPLNPKLLFHWTDSQNEIYTNWKDIVSHLLYIPMAHELIGFYTVPDSTDGILKVMRPYQIYAAQAISSVVSNTRWKEKNIYGGYIWHTTGAGKTLTSFKCAQLISNSKKADKVVFLLDRIELSNQTLLAYQGFADDCDFIQDTKSSDVLRNKLVDSSLTNSLIVTSIQKMNNITLEKGKNEKDIQKINEKKIVFIIDECHRSTFGDMLINIKKTFPNAIFFGFSGTPILDVNKKKLCTTSDIFGEELARYSISDGIRDGNVLPFDPIMVTTFDEQSMRNQVALEQAKALTLNDVLKNQRKKQIYYYFMNQVPMAGYLNDLGKYVKGIEDYIPEEQYNTKEHRELVADNILSNWQRLSVGFKFNAIFATNSIREACLYFDIFAEKIKNDKNLSSFKFTCLFDPNYDNNPTDFEKEKSMIKILKHYNEMYDQNFNISSWDEYKKDISLRLSRKGKYKILNKNDDSKVEQLHNKTLDLLIVVDQMLTGFDSKWINALYLDKNLIEENIVQAFSRTNRPFGVDKPHGIIKYYRRPYTMKKEISLAFEHYSGNKPYGVFVSKLEDNVKSMNASYDEIYLIFESDKIKNFSQLPVSAESRNKFIKEFKNLKIHFEAAKLQGFDWNKSIYGETQLRFNKQIYDTLIQRYKELFSGTSGSTIQIPYDIKSVLTQHETEKIDSDYLNSNFKKYVKLLQEKNDDKNIVKKVLEELHNSFSSLNQVEQEVAKIIINDINIGKLIIEQDKNFTYYIDLYLAKEKNDKIHNFSQTLGIDENQLREIMNSQVNEQNLNSFGRFDKLIYSTMDKTKFINYWESRHKQKLKSRLVLMTLYDTVKEFILTGGQNWFKK